MSTTGVVLVSVFGPIVYLFGGTVVGIKCFEIVKTKKAQKRYPHMSYCDQTLNRGPCDCWDADSAWAAGIFGGLLWPITGVVLASAKVALGGVKL